MMRAADLPDGLKQQLLRHLGNQVGQSTVNHWIAQYGEDAVVDMVLQAVLKTHRGSSSSSYPASVSSGHLIPINPWSSAFAVISRALQDYWMVWTLVVCTFGWAGVVLSVTIGALIFMVAALASQINIWRATSAALAWTLGGALVLALLVGVGYVAWIGVPWIGSGVGQWWEWLGGHFW